MLAKAHFDPEQPEDESSIGGIASAAHPLDSKQRILAVLKAYLDESGTKNSPKIFAMGGAVASETEWSLWHPQWKAILKNPGGGRKEIEYMHMKECVHGSAQFKGWPKEESNRFPLRLIPTLIKPGIYKVSSAILMEDFRDVIKGELLQKVKSPYYLCMLLCMKAIADKMREMRGHWVGRKERVAYIFEEQAEYEIEATRLFYDIKNKQNGERLYKLESCTYAPKTRFTPLQVADMMAWETHREMRRRIGDADDEFRERWSMLSSTNYLGYWWDREELEKLASDPNAFIDD
jgi:hypothetical protein